MRVNLRLFSLMTLIYFASLFLFSVEGPTAMLRAFALYGGMVYFLSGPGGGKNKLGEYQEEKIEF